MLRVDQKPVSFRLMLQITSNPDLAQTLQVCRGAEGPRCMGPRSGGGKS